MPKIISLALIMASIALASTKTVPSIRQEENKTVLSSQVTNTPAQFWYIWWTGVGKVGDFLVSNAMQGGIFSRLASDQHIYDGLPAEESMGQTGSQMGKTCEYPKGSKEFYLYANGFWFGALYPNTAAVDTIWKPNVSKAAYNSDIGAMSVPEMSDAGSMGNQSLSGLYFSDMIIPKTFGYEGEGNRLFAESGQSPESYQTRWPFADTMLNSKRPAGEKLDPANGDIVSHEDTYAVGGDWIPDSLAACIWILETGKYDGQGLGIRVEQRTYAWSTTALANAIVLNYKIRNMNEFTLKSPYFSYFLDPDIGTGGSKPGDNGGWDDLTGFDKARDLGYTYDANGAEQGWTVAPGYIGAVLLETPGDKGMTGFNCWENDSNQIVDNLGEDTTKYAFMASTNFTALSSPTDARMMLNSGPFPNLAPGKEYDFTLAVVLGATLDELKANVDSVKAAFEKGFLPVAGIEVDPSPALPLKLSVAGAISGGDMRLSYSLPSSGNIEIGLFDAAGRKLETLKTGREQTGTHELSVSASGLPSGVYFVRLATAGGSTTAKMLILD